MRDPYAQIIKKILYLKRNLNSWVPRHKEFFINEKKTPIRTLNLPNGQNVNDLNKFYQISFNDYKMLHQSRSFRSEFKGQIATFDEFAIMVRKPALELFHYLSLAEKLNLANRYLIYGQNGSGKTMTYNHILHYGLLSDDWIVFPVKQCLYFTVYYKEIVASTTHPGRFDLPHEASLFLKAFSHINSAKLKSMDLKTSQDYIWTKREKSEKGTPLIEIINYGIERPLYATDVVGILVKELKGQIKNFKEKILVVMEAVNFLFGQSQIPSANKNFLNCDDLSLVCHMKKMLQNDWCGGAIVCTLDQRFIFSDKKHNDTHILPFMPKILLKTEGFEFFDPFIPIEIPNFDELETYNMIDYYLERKWLNHPALKEPYARREVFYLTNGNGLDLYNFSRKW